MDSAQHKGGCDQWQFHAGTVVYRALPLLSTRDTLVSDSAFHQNESTTEKCPHCPAFIF